MGMRPEDRNARQVQQAFAGSATLGELEKHIAFLRSLGAPGDAHPMISFNDEGNQKPWKTDQPGREDDMQTVTPGAAELPVTPMAWQARAGGGRAL
jgi:hypothetical protein